MTFAQHVCLTPERVDTVMKTDAENAVDAVFLAIHSNHPLNLVDTVVGNRQGGNPASERISADEFLRRFLEPNRRHMQVVIQGDSGSGKSHLIKWMALNTQSTPTREVLVIPRVGMSLRSIVKKIINVLPPDLRADKLKKLNDAGSQAVTPDQRRNLMLDEIARAIDSDPRRGGLDDEGYLIKSLPDVFHDPPLRAIFSRRGGVMDELLAHIFEGSKDYQRLEHERLFREEDLPLQPSEFKELSGPARRVINQLRSEPQMVHLALEIINRNLPRAIPNVLQFNGDQLSELMLEIRRSLRNAGKELVLLIEDFATLQGIDRAILDQLILARSEENGLCDLRWAMAATRGYYEQVADTVQTRMDYLVDMDLPTGEGGLSRDQIIAFVARYLNAVRVNTAELERWKTEDLAKDSGTPVPNACRTCRFQQTCHSSFGQKGDFGLYPFTEDAIMNMAARTNVRLEERFNPRNLIRHVLRLVLEEGGRHLANGKFPTAHLLDRMQGSKLPAVDEVALKRLNPEHFVRLNALQGLWTRNPREYQQLADGIYTAFGLKPVHPKGLANLPKPANDPSYEPIDEFDSSVAQGHGPETRSVVVTQPVQVKPLRSALDEKIEAIEAWGKGGDMSQNLAQTLRDLIFPTLVTYIDWDRAGLAQSAFAEQRSGLFRNTSIIFKGRVTNALPPTITLDIPLCTDGRDASDELLRSAIAMIGLLRFNAQGDWNFPDGAESMVAVAECFERWAAHVINEFSKMLDGEQTYSPVPAAVEVLAAGAALAGKLGDANQPLSTQFNALFGTWPGPETLSHQTKAWKDLYKEIQPRQAEFVQKVQAWACGTKGGQAGSYVDPAQILPALQAIHQTGLPTGPVPDGVAKVQGYKSLADAHKRLRSTLPGVARGEWMERTNWLKRARLSIPQGVNWTDAIGALSGLLSAVRSNGIPVRPDAERDFAEALQAAAGVGFDNLVVELEVVSQETVPVRALPLLSRNATGKMITVVERLLKETERFLKEVETGVDNSRKGLEAQSLTLVKDQERIRASLAQLADYLGKLGGSHAS